MIGGVTGHMLPHQSGVPHLHRNGPLELFHALLTCDYMTLLLFLPYFNATLFLMLRMLFLLI